MENNTNVTPENEVKQEKKCRFPFFRKKWVRVTYNVLLYAFAIAGAAIIGAWVIFKLGLTNNSGSVDENYRYIMDVAEMQKLKDSTQCDAGYMMDQYVKLAAFGRFYPENAQLILNAARQNADPRLIEQMLQAASLYTEENTELKAYLADVEKAVNKVKQQNNPNVIPWMTIEEWSSLKVAIVKDKPLIDSAAKLTGVEARLIVGCLVGEQMRLFNSNREMYKKYLGPVKVLSVQSQFSLGVNGIKDFTAMHVERNLKDKNSEYYMGERYEHILDFSTADPTTERVNRLTDYHNHLYSYIYTGCILHQTKMQWERAGYDISNRPDILFTLFNVGFSQSEPKPDPKCGGSHVKVGGRVYTFGALGFDFYYSGELVNEFPIMEEHFCVEKKKTVADTTKVAPTI